MPASPRLSAATASPRPDTVQPRPENSPNRDDADAGHIQSLPLVSSGTSPGDSGGTSLTLTDTSFSSRLRHRLRNRDRVKSADFSQASSCGESPDPGSKSARLARSVLGRITKALGCLGLAQTEKTYDALPNPGLDPIDWSQPEPVTLPFSPLSRASSGHSVTQAAGEEPPAKKG